MANEQQQQEQTAQSDLDAMMRAVQERATLEDLGEDTSALNQVSDPNRTLQLQAYDAQPIEPLFDSQMDSMSWFDRMGSNLREDGLNGLADSVAPMATDGTRPVLPGDLPARVFHPLAETVRTHWRKARTMASIAAVQVTSNGKELFQDTVAQIVGSAPAQVAIGGFEPFARQQQVLYAALSGEGWGSFSRLMPSVTLENRVDEDGNPIELSPWAASMDAAWAAMSDDKANLRDKVDILREVNAEYMQSDLIEFRDVVDSMFGEDNMDEFYRTLYDGGVTGKVDMALLATTYGIAEIFVDPLTLFDFAPVALVKAGKQASSTASRTQRAARVARKTRRLPDAIDASKASEAHLNAAHAEYKARPSEAAAINLQNALNLHAERVDELDWFRRFPEHDQFDTVNLTNPARRNPTTIYTTDIHKSTKKLYGSGTSWERGLAADFDAGLKVDLAASKAPSEAFLKAWGTDLKISGIGHMIGHEHQEIRAIIDGMAEGMGLRVVPFASDGYKTAGNNTVLNGAYLQGTRTVFLNVKKTTPSRMLNTFLHEAWHHTFATHLGAEAKGELIQRLSDAGFDFLKYSDEAKSLGYQFGGSLDVADEFVARTLSNMAAHPEFWDTLRRIDPKSFDALAKESEVLAFAAMKHIDMLGQRRPRRWMTSDAWKDGHVVGYNEMGNHWSKHTKATLDAIELAYKQDPLLRAQYAERIAMNVNDVLGKMNANREAILATGRKTPVLDVEIERMQKYLSRLERDGGSARMADFIYMERSLRRRTVDEIHEAVMAERKSQAIRSTETMQPRESGWVQEDMFDTNNQVADRVTNGPDDAEYAAEGLARLVHGASEDDVAIRLQLIPERMAETGGRIVPGTKLGMIDMDQIRRTTWEAKKRAKLLNLELWEYDSGASFLDEALNAHKLENPPNKFKSGPDAETLDDLARADKPKPRKYKDVPYDDGWLPKPRKKTEDLMAEGWWDNHQATVFDRLAGGLYPRTWQLKAPALLRAANMWRREPMRVLEAVDPGKSWPLIRGAMLNSENETTRLKSVFNSAMEDFGALQIREKGGIGKVVSSGVAEKVKVNREMSERLFDILDSSPSSEKYAELTADLSSTQRTAVSNIRHELNLVADRLGIAHSETFIDGYIHHAFEPGWYAKGGMPPEHAGMSRSGNIFLGALLKRNGNKGFTRDAVGALEVYSRGVSRKLHMEPALTRFRERAKWHAKMDPRNQFFLKYADLTIGQLRGEPSLLGSLIDTSMGSVAASAKMPYKPGVVSRKVMAMNSLIYSSLLAGNRRYPIMSIATALATTGARYGMFRTLKGMFKMATPEGQLLFKHMQGDKQFARIFESDLMTNFTEKATKGIAETRLTGTPSTMDTENFIRGMSFWASLDETMTKLGHADVRMVHEEGLLQEAMFEAMRSTEEINHFFGPASKPPIFSRVSKSGSVLSSQFLSFPFKQSETLWAMGLDNPGYIARFMMLSGWVARVGAQELGIDLQDYLGINDSVPKIPDMQSPGVALLSSMARAMGELTALSEGHTSAEAAKQAVDAFIKDSEVMVPLLRLSREGAQMAEMDATGRKSTPGLGYGRDVDAEYIQLGDRISIPIPTGDKGKRSEVVGIAMGARTIQETLHQKARTSTRQAVNRAAIERMALVEKAKQAMDSGDWASVQKQMKRMVDMGLPVGDFSTAMEAKAAVNTMDWYITEMKRNPQLADQIISILQQHGILGEQDAEDQ